MINGKKCNREPLVLQPPFRYNHQGGILTCVFARLLRPIGYRGQLAGFVDLPVALLFLGLSIQSNNIVSAFHAGKYGGGCARGIGHLHVHVVSLRAHDNHRLSTQTIHLCLTCDVASEIDTDRRRSFARHVDAIGRSSVRSSPKISTLADKSCRNRCHLDRKRTTVLNLQLVFEACKFYLGRDRFLILTVTNREYYKVHNVV